MTTDLSPSDARTVRRCSPALRSFNEVGILEPVDIHVAGTLARLAARVGGEVDDEALLGLALAVRAPRLGHACVDLATVAVVAAAEDERTGDVEHLSWPSDPARWITALRRTGLAHDAGDLSGDDAPVRLVGTRVYLDRHLRDERAVGRRLAELAAADAPAAGPDRVDAVLTDLFGADTGEDDRQRAACGASATGRLTVVAGGPGTGKTYTVTRLVAMHAELARRAGRPQPRVALVAPTGKAAARVEESVHDGAAGLEVHPQVRAQLEQVSASTIHRLLGRAVGSQVRPRHDAQHPLEAELVIVDETSMVPLSLMARLLAALPASARLVLVGDPDQLESVEAGTVLGDVIGRGADARWRPPLADRVVTLTRGRRFGAASDIARLATAVRAGDEDTVVTLLADGGLRDVAWLRTQPDAQDAVEEVRHLVEAAGTRVLDAAADGDAAAAAEAAARLQVLCAHRRGPAGVGAWTARIERWLAAARPRAEIRPEVPGSWYPGRPVLLTRNDDRRQLYNGDSGVVVYRDGDGDEPAPVVAFGDAAGTREIAASRLGDVETAWAITIHKSQGSQYDHVVIVLPDAASRLLTRELLYTALTRARSQVTVVGTEDALRAAVRRRVERIGGLRDLLWPPDPGTAAEVARPAGAGLGPIGDAPRGG